MFELILDIAFLIWLGNKFGHGVAITVAVIEFIIFLCVIHSISRDEWKARLNMIEYWKNRGPYR